MSLDKREDENDQEIGNIDSISLPRLNPPIMTASNIESYFLSLEFWFAASGLGNQHDARKYNIVMAQVPPNKLKELRFIIDATPVADKYPYIKRMLMYHFADSQQKRLQRVLSDMPLGDMKPSQLYSEMRRVAGNSLSELVLLDLWASRLPAHAQAAVIASKGDPSEKASIADAIVDSMGLRSINAMETLSPTIPVIAPETPASSCMNDLQREIVQLTSKFEQMFRSQRNSRDRSRSCNRSRTDQRFRSGSAYDMCWYHRTFGREAHTCRKPCFFSPSGQLSNPNQQ
ncbi:uncharacterized protein LOC129765756 [Toxorhynchites rutilus septentrionalis]|uniref:uncharacterized protein LOC129765756 n=1 Tax=Toxorhynchites rutilus septentrionalis TaxID=329112 RepID=UPI00247A5BC6|nr:uncharacterized protein LOC129765756 [Toxorhynchites rutilus septentrionalis]